MTKAILSAFLALAAALPARAAVDVPADQAQSQDYQAWQSQRQTYDKMPGYQRPKAFQKKVDYYMEMTHDLVPPERLLKDHPLPTTEYKGLTVASAIDASFSEISKFKAGIQAFQAEVQAMSAEGDRAKGDAPNRYLVGQGWRIVKAMAGVFNDELVPAANDLYKASAKGNENLEILIAIAGGNNKLFDIPGAPQATLISGTETELQLIEEVQREHNAAKATRQKGDMPLYTARAKVPKIYDMVVEYDKAYAEYARGMSHLSSGGARLAMSTLHGLSQAVTTSQAASGALVKAEGAEQDAIDAVRACTEGNLSALQSPSNQAAQSNASNLNQVALQKVRAADSARQAANAILERPESQRAVSTSKVDSYAPRVHYESSDKVGASRAGREASTGAQDLQPDRQPEPDGQRP